MQTYVAFLRGINVGGNAIVSMADLKQAFLGLGFIGVKTYINSGNVIFTSPSENEEKLLNQIEEHLEKRFGRAIKTILRSKEELGTLLKTDPYKGYDLTDKSLYFLVVFMAEVPKHSFPLPYEEDSLGLTIAAIQGRDIALVLDRERFAKTPDTLKFITKEFRGLSTTRTWKTIEKVVSLA